MTTNGASRTAWSRSPLISAPCTKSGAGNRASPPAVVVHALDHAVAALAAAADSSRPITLLSAPDAGIYAGPGWFKALVGAAKAAVPAAQFTAVLDCGDDAGAAQGALRAGIEVIVFTGRTDVAARLAAIAALQAARLLTVRPDPLLDLGRWFFADPETLRRYCAERLASLPPIC
jgi:hypothetical protein